MICVEAADGYFEGTTLFQAWSQYSKEQQAAAISMAKREFGRALGRALREDEPPYKAGDTVREEFAAYEQALYTLLRDAQPNKGGNAVPSLDQDDQRSPAFTLSGASGQWSPRALSWLAGSIGVVARNG